MKLIDKKKEIKIIKDALFNQIQEVSEYPYLYSVIEFGFYDNQGLRLPYSEIKKYWDKTEVIKTCKLIYRKLKEHFGMTCIWMFIERHKPILDDDGEVIREGRFHINLISSSIPDGSIEEPNRKLRKLINDTGGKDYYKTSYSYTGIDGMKEKLVDACCKTANWVNRYKYSVETKTLYEPTDLESVVYYCLGDYNGKREDKKGNPIPKELDFMDIVVFEASDFYKP